MGPVMRLSGSGEDSVSAHAAAGGNQRFASACGPREAGRSAGTAAHVRSACRARATSTI
jgi:hypothetical protein